MKKSADNDISVTAEETDLIKSYISEGAFEETVFCFGCAVQNVSTALLTLVSVHIRMKLG